MADLDEKQASGMSKLIGSDSSGQEQTPVQSTSGGGLHNNLRNTAGTEIGTVANPVITAHPDIVPATQAITALDVVTTPFVGANGQVFYIGTPTANSAAVFPLISENMVSIQSSIIGTGGTLVVEVSYDGGTNWIRPSVYQPGTQIYTNGFTAPFVGLVATVGVTHVRVRATTSWSGTATIAVVRSQNNLDTKLIGIVSVANSTSAALGAGATFTGTAEDVTDYGSITVQVFTDQASAAGGFKSQYSTDATNWDDGDAYSIAITPAGNGKYFSFPPQAKFFRLVYVNGATLQTAFRMQTIYRRAPVKFSSHRIGDTLDDENDAELVKANIIGRTAAGNYVNLRATVNADLGTADIANDAAVYGSVALVAATAKALNVSGTNLANRKFVTLDNSTTQTIYWGYDNTVSNTNYAGRIFKDQQGSWAVGAGITVWIYIVTGPATAHTSEGA